jgi:hypothetical protein
MKFRLELLPVSNTQQAWEWNIIDAVSDMIIARSSAVYRSRVDATFSGDQALKRLYRSGVAVSST